MATKREIVEAFLKWYKDDPHSRSEDFYVETMNATYLKSLSREAFIQFFFEFANEGGKIQSGGERTAGGFRSSVSEHYEEFKTRIFELFDSDFNLDDWLAWADEFKFLGQGLSTIILNRVDKTKYVVVNEKSIDGLARVGYLVSKSASLQGKFLAVKNAEEALLQEFPVLENFYRVDAMMHFIIGTNEGKRLTLKPDDMDYFDFDGMRDFSALVDATYDSKTQGAKWYKSTIGKFEHLVILLSQRLSIDLKVTYTENPMRRAGRGKILFKDYALIGFSPDGIYSRPNNVLFIKLQFYWLRDNPTFGIELDINDKLADNPFRENRDSIRDDYSMSIPVDDNFPKDWESLLNTIDSKVRELVQIFRDLANGKSTNPNFTPTNKSEMTSLNTILYGPPGTGKTYRTIDHALAIIERNDVKAISAEREQDKDAVKKRFDDLQASGRIAFCTFHQSMGYEDFIEGIKPLKPEDSKPPQYDVVDGIFKRLCVEATFALYSEREQKAVSEIEDFSQLYEQFASDLDERQTKGEELKFTTVSGGAVYFDSLSTNGNIIVKHKNGERTYVVSKQRAAKLSNDYPDLSEVKNIDAQFRESIGGSNATSYWAVLNAIRHQSPKPATQTPIKTPVDYETKKDAIKGFKLTNYDVETAPKYVLIVDEINRGNVAQIFGELITLIEPDKRLGKDNEISVTLPYSRDSFSVPPNLYLIGTMNTADRSVEALDTALRRRFAFRHMAPQPELLREKSVGEIDLEKMLKTINQRLEVLLDADHTIGHAWLMGIENFDGLKTAFKDKIMPLLQEFFYHNYEKIGLVLGERFVHWEKVESNIFAKFNTNSGLGTEYNENLIFSLANIDELEAKDFISIYPSDKNKAG